MIASLLHILPSLPISLTFLLASPHTYPATPPKDTWQTSCPVLAVTSAQDTFLTFKTQFSTPLPGGSPDPSPQTRRGTSFFLALWRVKGCCTLAGTQGRERDSSRQVWPVQSKSCGKWVGDGTEQGLWDSWAQSPSVSPTSLITGKRLHSVSMTSPEFQRADSSSC